jgi:hypothetical protein
MMAQTEHISLAAAADADTSPAPQQYSRILATFTLSSRFRGLHTELSLRQNHLLQVNALRPGSQPQSYSVDLRFVSPKPILDRNVAWLWVADSFVLLVLAGLELSRALGAEAATFGNRAWYIGIGAALAAFITTLWCVRSTTESLRFVSANGNVTVVKVCGGIGSAKTGKKFFVQLIRAIHEAQLTAPDHRRHHLRDEMREHHRLRELGALSQQQYAAAKARILMAHS